MRMADRREGSDEKSLPNVANGRHACKFRHVLRMRWRSSDTPSLPPAHPGSRLPASISTASGFRSPRQRTCVRGTMPGGSPQEPAWSWHPVGPERTDVPTECPRSDCGTLRQAVSRRGGYNAAHGAGNGIQRWFSAVMRRDPLLGVDSAASGARSNADVLENRRFRVGTAPSAVE